MNLEADRGSYIADKVRSPRSLIANSGNVASYSLDAPARLSASSSATNTRAFAGV